MRMSRKSLLAYDRLVGAAGDKAATAYRRLLSLWISNNPQATENEVIDAAAYFACTTLNDYGEAAAAAADELCRQLAAQDKISGTTHTDYVPDRKELGKILGSQKSREPLAQGDRAKFVVLSSDRVKDECHRAANKQMLKSAKALGCKRYARVPVGDSKTCKFCVSVAANGFHGLTEEGAKKLTRLHDNCRCKVIPGFGKNSSVEGYDPEDYKEAYELRKKLEQEGYSVAQIQRAMAGEPVESLGAPNSGKGGRPHNGEITGNHIPKSVGAARGDVLYIRFPDGRIEPFLADPIDGDGPFAGNGANKPLRKRYVLAELVGGTEPDLWSHDEVHGWTIDPDTGEERFASVHLFAYPDDDIDDFDPKFKGWSKRAGESQIPGK